MKIAHSRRFLLFVALAEFVLGFLLCLVLISMVFAAETKSVLDLLGERTKLNEIMTGLQKDFEAQQAEFQKTKPAVEYNEKVKKLREEWEKSAAYLAHQEKVQKMREKYQEAERRVNEINKAIADQAEKGKATK